MSSAPIVTTTDSGITPATASSVYEWLSNQVNIAFNKKMNPDESTPQGQIMTSVTNTVTAAQDALLSIANGFDPQTAAGRMLDGLARIYDIDRQAAQYTSVTGLCRGAAGTKILAGARATSNGHNYFSQGGVIGADGTVEIEFICQDAGEIACPAGSLKIDTAIPGWDSVTNTQDGIIGRDEENDYQLLQKYNDSLEKNSIGMTGSIEGAIRSLSGVNDVKVYNNSSSLDKTLSGGVVVPAGKTMVVVAGGDPQSIAAALYTSRGHSGSYIGNTTLQVTDTRPPFEEPYPTFESTFTIADTQQIYVNVEIENGVGIPSDYESQIKSSITAVFNNSADKKGRPNIGSVVLANRFVCPVSNLGDWCNVYDINVSLDGSSFGKSATVKATSFPEIISSNIKISLV